ncbi:EF-hand domain-containing family member C2 isoform X2 [Nilaparvata lugens]|uniref:EF-hand domain-containing family member C2 isoform X1 n=1 Tax=Nilaparvata lugens TaxID=108931 RepID=UPI00193DF0AD|nr:EF-hand domain-containing family member C2 isoform X1 [Nilaparvata lugens]XP_039295469.1 EF-hand domain-containing family member C2 isoform X2 [Nilaparvata lugens]
MLRCPNLPLLPEYSINDKVGQSQFHKSHHFDVKDVAYLSDKEKPGIVSRYPAIYARGECPTVPAWITYDRQVLKFNAYFQEMIQEVAGYNHIVRKCFIYFFLEDGTIKVIEPKVPNSGIPQGCLMSRQRLRHPHSEDFYDIIDLNVGKSVEFHGRVFKITDCDHFTRTFLNRLGIPVPERLEAPFDPYTRHRSLNEDSFPKKPHVQEKAPLRKLADLDRKVLNFSAYWDDRHTQFGQLHLLQVRYYLADDTVEVKDVTDKDHSFLLMHRDKLPKEYRGMPITPGDDRPVSGTLLNVVNTQYTHDRLLAGADKPQTAAAKTQTAPGDYYKDCDLRLGAVVNVYGRKVVLIDCDNFTKQFYKAKYSIDDFTPVQRPLTDSELAERENRLREPTALPPYNGFGTHEDSAINCRTVFPFPPIKNYKQFYEKDKVGYDSHVLRFSARLISNKPDDSIRSFILSFYLSDDTISVFEVACENSGFKGGMLISRRKILKPGEMLFSSQPPQCYGVHDLYVGSELELEVFKFQLTSADEYALHYMEKRSNEFPKSNSSVIVSKLREAVRPFYKDFVAKHLIDQRIPILTFRQFRDAMKSVLGDCITEHEILTLARHYATEDQTDPLPSDLLRSVIQCELKRLLFNSFERVEESFRYRDPDCTGFVSKETAYCVLRGCRLPLDVTIINLLLDKCSTSCGGVGAVEGQVSWAQVMSCLDYKTNPANNIQPVNIPQVMSYMARQKQVTARPVDFVQMEKLINDLNLEKNLTQQVS